MFGHRFILSLRSEYFRSTFTTGMKESAQQEIPVMVCKAEFVTIMRFIYTGDTGVVTEENVVDVLDAANYFSETRLKCVCEDILKRGAGTFIFLICLFIYWFNKVWPWSHYNWFIRTYLFRKNN